MTLKNEIDRDYEFAKVSMNWYGWGSPVGMGIGLVSIGLFLWLLHLANILK